MPTIRDWRSGKSGSRARPDVDIRLAVSASGNAAIETVAVMITDPAAHDMYGRSAFIQMTPEEALDLAFSLNRQAWEARRMKIKALATTLKEENKDVHTRHCCIHHGCKYGYDREDLASLLDGQTCSVATGEKPQEHPCEDCENREY